MNSAAISSAPWNGLSVRRFQIPPDEVRDVSAPVNSVDLHLSRPYQLEWKRGGRFSRTEMVPGAICISPANEPLSLRWRDHLEIIRVNLAPVLVANAAESLKMRGPIEIPERHGDLDPQVSHLCRVLWAEAESGYTLGRVFGESLATALASCLLQRYSSVSALSSAAGVLSPRRWKDVQRFIEEHLHTNLSLDDLAGVARLSPFHFSRCFKATTGTSPHQYLIARRVERARQIMADSDLPLAEIAVRCGFSDQSHLTRHMKRHLGLTPIALRPRRPLRKNLL